VPPVLEIKTTKNMKEYFWLKASTNGYSENRQKFLVWICGEEIVNITGKVSIIIKEWNETSLPNITYLPPYIDSTDPDCPVIQYDLNWKNLNTGGYFPYTGDMVEANLTTGDLSVYPKTPGRVYLYLRATTVGTISGILEIEVEICGTEVVSFMPYKPDSLYLEYLQYSGQLNIQTVREHMYQ
jgi:hypothetical protein